MIRKVYEVNPMVNPKCGGLMKVVTFITDYQAVKGRAFGSPLARGLKSTGEYCGNGPPGKPGAPAAVHRIIDHLKLRFIAEKPPPARVLTEVALMTAEERAEYFSWQAISRGIRSLSFFERFRGHPER